MVQGAGLIFSVAPPSSTQSAVARGPRPASHCECYLGIISNYLHTAWAAETGSSTASTQSTPVCSSTGMSGR